MMMQHMRTGVICAGLIAMLAGLAQADGWSPYLCGSPWYLPPSVHVRDQIPPYFALHPPVYYSYPVPRTYGYSPYAYPPGTKTPEVSKPQPVVIRNPFVPSKATGQSERDRVAQAPLRIINPYLAGAGEQRMQVYAGATQRPRPQVVFPMAAGDHR